MKAFVINKYSKKQSLQRVELSLPDVKENDILVEIHAAGVNLLDSKIKTGEFKLILPYKLPLILGHDVAGIVVKTGKNVKKFKTGDQIYARVSDYRIGTFAQFIAIDEKDAALKPTNLSMEEAASIPLVGLTSWQVLVERAGVKSGQKVFIQAGSGGVGTFAIQLAKHLGAVVATTAGAQSTGLLKNLGADIVIDYKNSDFEKILSDYDAVLNSQDQKTLEKSLRILKPGGKLISISGPPTPVFAKEIKAPWFVKIVLSLLSSSIRKKAKHKNVDYSFLFMKADGEQLSEITKLIESGVIKPIVDKIFPFEKTNDALSYVESGRAKGKVVIKIK
ncbi:NADP-dependent oxidoreductase [Flavobacterium sp. S87F.05.LMB.W.Kidney.N]|uniref:NADP-dependent oxidoreductase n=1 Tax=Flavobacterium sp. S87F.05.LMB.W.Kidney.N TaxID=1278758 RepID=UPI001064EBB0|nr:NADP-dependent oxidoreductase [Flavobacterium sp. S87F.05.LMB.W.Kidney.N]TDX10465.1 NADPH:quinone reductase-like Zn-dependent oxidoreductase [Flavobacterium sp. S87F.05.LMB.W.Kidney.N]